ncbi:MAG TPA: serine/threonine-protein kinase [Solirubrobacteraceae bacterium]|nr:serine/threonine-protein kinase [Solirubrobacteraceae bacterium]
MAVASSLSRYRPVRKIASGGMATISLAEDTVLGRPVALKRLLGTASQTGVSRLRREALVGASVSHPNLVSIYDVVTEDDDLVIVMEYVDGHTLKDALAGQGRLAPNDAMPILRGVGSALDAIHARGIVHRDVKPSNILLGRGGAVKLADLGIAAAPDHTSITTEGSVLGSFSYMAPEQLEAAPATPAMDIYALAAVGFETLSGRRAREENNPLALAHAIATQPPPDLSAAWPQAPAALVATLKRGMSRDPAQRPRSAGELVHGLVAGLPAPEPDAGSAVPEPDRGRSGPRPRRRPQAASRPVPAAPEPPRPRPTSRRNGAAGAGGAAAAGAAGAAAAAGAAGASWSAPGAASDPPATEPGTSATEPVRRGPPGAPPPRRPDLTHRPHRARRRRGWLAPVLLGVVALIVLAAVLSSGGSGRPTAAARRPRTHATRQASVRSSPRAPARSTTSATTPAAPTGPGGNGTPVSAVERFYELAAAHRFQAAWALADPAFRNQLGGYDSFVSGQQADQRIIFDSAQVTNQTSGAATVAISTTSIRTTGTQQCGGTVDVVAGGGGWLLNQISIHCRPADSPSPPPGHGKHHSPPGHQKHGASN